jgi:hypothetical protein
MDSLVLYVTFVAALPTKVTGQVLENYYLTAWHVVFDESIFPLATQLATASQPATHSQQIPVSLFGAVPGAVL